MADIQVMSFNAGELSELLDGRSDLEKYYSGCRLSENMIPLPYGPSERRPGTYFVAECKNNDKKAKLVSFQYSTQQAYILEYGDEYIRFCMDRGQIIEGVGTEDLSGVGNLVAHWKLNEEEGTTVVNDDSPGTYDGTATASASTLHETGKVGTGCFDLDGQYTVEIANDAVFNFTNNTDDSAFSIACWAYVTQQDDVQNLLSKWRDQNTAREWRFSLNNERKLQLHLADAQTDISGDVVAQWKLNEAADNKTVLDTTANDHDGLTQTDDTNVLTATGKIDKCLDLGDADCVVITNAAGLSFGDGLVDSKFSIAAWIYVVDSAVTPQHILTKYDETTDANKREWRLFLTNWEKICLTIYDEDADAYQRIMTNDPLSLGWHFVVVTYDGRGGDDARDGMKIYIDNIEVGVTPHSYGTYVAMENLDTKVVIGASYGRDTSLGEFFDDKIDNVILFNVKITPARIATLWNDGNGTEDLTVGATPSMPYAVSNTALTIGWHFLVCTYSAPATAADAANGIIFYVDGVKVDSTPTIDTNYQAMQAAGEAIRIGSQNSVGDTDEKFWGDKIDEVSIFNDVLTPTEIASLYSAIPYEIESSYQEADLPGLQHAQSADVLFNVHSDYPQSKLIRYAHNVWEIEDIVFDWPPFLDENITDTTLTCSGTTGTMDITASTPIFTADHVGSYWLIKHPRTEAAATGNSQSDSLAFGGAPENGTILIDVKGSWRLKTTGDYIGIFVLERTYDGTNWHTLQTFNPGASTHYNITGTETLGDAQYRVRTVSGTAGTLEATVSVERYYHYGIVEITGFTTATSVTATVVRTVGATTATKLWSEGAWSDERGYPVATTFFEGRQFYAGTSYRPLDIWGSNIPNYENMELGTLDTDAVRFVVDSGMQNMIRWLVGQEVLLIGTSGGEWRLGSIDPADAITPTNPMRPRIQTTYGSKEIQALLLANAVLFVDAQGRRVRGAQYIFEKGEAGGYDAPDYTMLSEHITKSGIIDMAYQQNPYPVLWCVRDDGVLIGMVFEPGQKVWGWFRCVIDGDIESVAVIPGVDEDEIWIIVKREIGGVDKRYIEYFKPRDWGDDQADCFFVDSGLSFDGGAAVTITGISKADPGVVTAVAHGFIDGDQVRISGVVGMTDVNNKVFTVDSPATDSFSLRDKLDTTNWDTSGYDIYVSGGTVQKVDNVFGGLGHLEGETVSVLGDGSVHANVVVSSAIATLTDYFNKCHIGLPYTSKLMPMKLAVPGANIRGKIKRIHQIIFSFYKTLGAKFGTTEGSEVIPFRRTTDAMGSPPPIFTGEKEQTFPGGYELNGDIYVEQTQPLPMTVRSITAKFQIHGD